MAKRAVLVTGFEPFGGSSVNPSALAAKALDARELSGVAIVGEVLPVVFGDALAALQRAVARVEPELVICVGEASGTKQIAVERVAINIEDARIPDNAGAKPIDRPVVTGGPVAYWSTLPIKAIVAALAAREIPACVSHSAGTFVCNHVFYGLMHALAGRDARGGFVHVPQLPEQDDQHNMPLARVVLALEIAIATAIDTREDLRVSGGALS